MYYGVLWENKETQDEFLICFRNYIDDDRRSIVIGVQAKVTNRPKMLYSKDMVLSVREKSVTKLAGVC